MSVPTLDVKESIFTCLLYTSNALSEHMTVKIYRDGCIYQDTYHQGHPTTKLENGLLPVIGKSRETGTEINFLPDGEIFEKTRFKARCV